MSAEMPQMTLSRRLKQLQAEWRGELPGKGRGGRWHSVPPQQAGRWEGNEMVVLAYCGLAVGAAHRQLLPGWPGALVSAVFAVAVAALVSRRPRPRPAGRRPGRAGRAGDSRGACRAGSAPAAALPRGRKRLNFPALGEMLQRIRGAGAIFRAWAAGDPSRRRYPVRRPRPGRGALVQAGLPVLIGLLAALAVTWLGHPGSPAVPLRLTWAFSPGSDTVTVRVMPAGGTSGRQVLARSHLTVSENGARPLRRWPAGGEVMVPVPPGRRTRLLVQITGPQPLRQTLTVTAPPPPRITTSRGTGRQARLYCFADPAGRAVYITIDDGWTPARRCWPSCAGPACRSPRSSSSAPPGSI